MAFNASLYSHPLPLTWRFKVSSGSGVVYSPTGTTPVVTDTNTSYVNGQSTLSVQLFNDAIDISNLGNS